jgi:group I intron endonuclease
MKITGIYKIQSTIKPERIYIGSAVDIKRRWYEHTHDLKLNNHNNPKLQNHYNKYGNEDLIFTVMKECSIKLLLEREQYYIDKLKPFYNICCVAGNTLGIRYKLSDEIRKKMSDKRMGHIGWNRGLTKETDSRLIISEETKLKISKSKLGKKRKPFSDKHKENIRLSKIGISTWSKDRKNPSGRYCSEETRKKMRMAWESRKLLPISVETRKKHSETNKRIGHKPPSWKGKFHTEATKEKMRGNKYGSKNKGNHCKPHTRKSPTKETIEKRNNTRRLNKLKMEENGLK